VEAAEILRQSGFVADTVADEDPWGSDDEATLDLDFANIRSYPPGEHSGIVVLRLKRPNIPTALSYVRRLATALANRRPHGELWIVDYR